MENQPRVSGFREAFPDSNESSWSSKSYPPSYQPWPENHPANRYPTDPEDMPEPFRSIHRLDTMKSDPISPEIQSPGLESVWVGEGDKEVFTIPPAEPDSERQPHVRDEGERTKRICGMPRIRFWIFLVIVAIIVIALGIGLGVGLWARNATAQSSTSGNSSYAIGGALNSEFYTHTGAFNGSGLALASQSFDASDHGDIVLYFQHNSGQIRYEQLSETGSWVGGSISETVAADAKNGTPISAVSYVLNQTDTWHVFYIDTNNTIKQKSNSNVTNVWVDGPVSAQNLVALDADQVGMQACWYGNDYGDADYLHTPLPSDGDTSNSSVSAYQDVGMHLWYASDNTTFQQMGWRDGDLEWTFQGSWTDKDGHAGVGCYSWGPGTVNYVSFVNLEQTVEFWWKDTNTTLNSTTAHPINAWTNTSIAINNVHPSTSLGYTNIFYAQDATSDNIYGYNISWAAENTSIVTVDSSDSNAIIVNGGNTPGLPGTHMSVTALPTDSGGNDLMVLYQVNGSDVTVFTRDIVSGLWTQTGLPIPAT